VANVARGQQG